MMMQLIDEKKTCKNVINLLKQYQQILHIAQRNDPSNLASPSLSGMPSSKTYINNQEEKMTIYADAKLVIMAIQNALKTMPNQRDAQLIYDLFISKEPISNDMAQQKYFLSHNALYHHRNRGLLAFAEHYQLEDLNYYNYVMQTN